MTQRKRKKPIRSSPLSRERVLSAALRLADKQGLEALSMRKLAEGLKVEAMSLYNHVTNKEDLLSGLVECVVEEIAIPERGRPWREAMHARAVSAHATLMRHPWATMLFVSRINVGPRMLHYVDATIGCLREAGFSYPLADYAWNALDAYLYGFTLQRLNFPIEVADYAASAQQFMPMIPASSFPYLNGMSQEVISGRHDGLQHLGFGLDLILDGLERLLVPEVRKQTLA